MDDPNDEDVEFTRECPKPSPPPMLAMKLVWTGRQLPEHEPYVGPNCPGTFIMIFLMYRADPPMQANTFTRMSLN